MKHGKTMTAAEAGPRGEKVRSDACVRVEPETSGKVVVTVRGKVASLYGDAITAQMTEGCAALGVEHARVIVDDGGALPFVLAARLEAAVRRAECGTPNAEFLLARRPGNRGPSEKGRHRRTRLYVPGGRPNFMANAHLHAPDGVILDLEDSVAPAEKDAARVMVRCALRSLDWGDAERMVRINPLPGGIRDLPFAVGHGAQMILIPKVESAAQVEEVAAECARLAHGCGEGAPWILPILESAAGVLAAAEIAAAHTTVAAVTIGLEDYTADIGAQRT
ncbi:MAG: aldolase/citrate lyase family protein, partial [Gemmatimonadota bacterium]|nr:aldolase/citrate lyase family protein [Gemmatimonadota bacterium]